MAPLRGGWRGVGLARVPSPGLPDLDLELVELAVLDARCETDDILAVKRLRDRVNVGPRSSVSFSSKYPPLVSLAKRLEPAVRTAPHLSHTVEVVALEADGVDHHPVVPRLVQHLPPADRMLGVLAVGEDQAILRPSMSCRASTLESMASYSRVGLPNCSRLHANAA